MIWTLLLLAKIAVAEDLAVERYCFNSPQRAAYTSARLKPVLVPTDKIDSDGNCFSISMRPHRRELIQNFIRNIEPQVRISFSSAQSTNDPCQLKIEKIKTLSKTETSAEISSASNVEQSQTTRELKDTTSIQTLKDFEITIDQDTVKGSCRFITPTRYEITLEVRKDPKPLIPGLAEGSTVIITQPATPPDQETSKLTTTLQLTQGQKVEIGSLVKDLRNKDQKIDVTNTEFEMGKTDGTQLEKVFLGLE